MGEMAPVTAAPMRNTVASATPRVAFLGKVILIALHPFDNRCRFSLRVSTVLRNKYDFSDAKDDIAVWGIQILWRLGDRGWEVEKGKSRGFREERGVFEGGARREIRTPTHLRGPDP